MPMTRYHSFICDSARWEGFELRPGDVVVTTPPKCGTTWMQMACLVLIHGPVLPDRLSTLAPWLDQLVESVESVHGRLSAQTHRRVIKTHTPLDGLPVDAGVTYIGVGRDPRDVALSAANHFANMNIDALLEAKAVAGLPPELPARTPRPTDPDDALLEWVEVDRPVGAFGSTLQFTIHHLLQLWSRRDEDNIELFHYGEMKRDPLGQLRRLASAMDVEVDESAWPALVAATSFDSMRSNADALAPNGEHGLWHDNEAFFAAGRMGSWRETVSAPTLARYDERLQALAGGDDEFVSWLHGGSWT
jgi:aryl sulfotransferase